MNYINSFVFDVVFEEYDGDLDAFNPKFWAFEAATQIDENVVLLSMVRTDYSEIMQECGDTVNVVIPGKFVVKRKGDGDVVEQEGKTRTVPVQLNQHLYVHFPLSDKARTLAAVELIDTYMTPAMEAIVSGMTRVIAGVAPQFFTNSVGNLNINDATIMQDLMVDARKKANDLHMPKQNRNFIVTSNTEADMLRNSLFVEAQKTADGGAALHNGFIGRLFGWDITAIDVLPFAADGSTKKTVATVNLEAGYLKGESGAILLSGMPATIAVGNFVLFRVKGNRYPYRVTAVTTAESVNVGVILDKPLMADIANDDEVEIYDAGAAFTAYTAGHVEAVVVDGIDDDYAPAEGMVVAVGSDVYTIMTSEKVDAGKYSLLFTEPVKSAIAENAPVNFAPEGSYNLGFYKDAVVFVSRPLMLPASNVASAVVRSDLGVGVRVTIGYDMKAQKDMVTVDVLCGVKVVHPDRGICAFN